MSEKLVCATIIPRQVGEKFYARPVNGGVQILVEVISVTIAGGSFFLVCKALGM